MTLDELKEWEDQVNAQFSVPREERDAAVKELEVGTYPGDEPATYLKAGRPAFNRLLAERRPLVDQVKKARVQESQFHPFPKVERASQAVSDFFRPSGSQEPESVMDLSEPPTAPPALRAPAPPAPTSRRTPTRTSLNPDDEAAFQDWYADTAKKTGLNANPDDPLHKYDMRAFWRSGQEPAPDPSDVDPVTKQPRLHFSSEFKDDDHPNRFVVHQGQVLDSKYNRPVDPAHLNSLATPEQKATLEYHLRAQGLLADDSSASAALPQRASAIAQQPPAALQPEPTFDERNQSFQARLGRNPTLDWIVASGWKPPAEPVTDAVVAQNPLMPPTPRVRPIDQSADVKNRRMGVMPDQLMAQSPVEKYVAEPLKEFGKSVVYRGPVEFFDWLDRKSGQAAKAVGITRTGKSIYTMIADLARSHAEEQPTDPAWNTQFLSELGKVPTRDLPKLAAFTASLGPVWGFAGLGVLDGAEKGTKEAIVEGFKGLMTGKIFKGFQGLGMKERAIAGGGLFGSQAFAEGERDPGKLAGHALTGAILGVPGPVKGETFGDRLSGYKASSARPPGGNIFENLGVNPETATTQDVRRAFRDQAGIIKEATVSAKTDTERLSLTKQFQDLRRDFKDAETVLGKIRPPAPTTPEALQPSGPRLALPPGTEPTLIAGPPRPNELQGETVYGAGPIELQPNRFDVVAPPGRGRLPNVPPPLQPEPPIPVPAAPAGATVDTLAKQIRPSMVKPSDFLPDQLAVNTERQTPFIVKKATAPPPALARESKTSSYYNDFMAGVAKREEQDAAGQSVLDDLDMTGRTPRQVVDEFWTHTYPQLPPEVQTRFHRYIKRQTGFQPGSVVAAGNGKEITAKNWQDTYPADQAATDAEYLEGTERGLIALMEIANRRTRQAIPSPSGLQPSIASAPPKELTQATQQTDRSAPQNPLAPVTAQRGEIVQPGATAAAESPIKSGRRTSVMGESDAQFKAYVDRGRKFLETSTLPDYAKQAIMSQERMERTNRHLDPHLSDSTWETEHMPIASLKKENPELWGKKFQHRGSVSKGPIVLDRDGQIIDGNNRTFEAIQRGDINIEVLRPTDSTAIAKSEVWVPKNPLDHATHEAAESPSVEDIHALADAKGLPWNNDKTFMAMTEQVTGKQHLDALSPEERGLFATKLRRLPDVGGVVNKATTVPRSQLPPEQSADLMARAEKAQADLEIAGSERGGRYFQETQGKGSDQDITGLKSATADWYKEATTGPKKLSRQRVDTAVAKILADKGRDVGTDVQRIKELLLQDREFQSSPFAPKTDAEWQTLIEAATGKSATDAKAKTTPKPHDYASTQINLPAPIAKSVQDLSAKIPDHDLAEDGRAAQPHVTVKYGLHGNDPKAVQKLLAQEPPIKFTVGDINVFHATHDRPSDVLQLTVQSDDLARLNTKISEAVPNTETQGEYKPHITIAEVKPGLGVRYANELKNTLKGKTLTLNSVAFSDTDGTQTEIRLTGTKTEQSGQQEIPVPPPTIGERPIIAREATHEEAPLFSKAAREPEPEQTTLTELGAPIQGQEAAQQKRVKPSTPRIPVDPVSGGTAKPLTQILVDVSKGTGQKLTKATLRAGVAGTYFPGSTATTIRYAGDLDTTAHELSHALDDQFGIVKDWAKQSTSPFDAELKPFAEHGSIQTSGPRSSPQYVRAEGVAEWLRAWLVNPKAAEAAAPQFSKHALAKLSPETRKALDQFSTDIRTFAGSSAHSKIMANVQWEAPKSSVLDWMTGGKTKNSPGFKLTWADTANAELVDRLHAFDQAITYARRQRGLGQPALPANDPQLLVRLYSGIHAKMDQIFEKGMIDTKNQHVTKGGLPWLVESLDPKRLDAEMQDVASYMIAQRTVEKITKDIDQAVAAIKKQQLLPQEEKEAIRKATSVIRHRKISGAGGGLEQDIQVAEQHLKDVQTSDPKKRTRLDTAATRYRQWADANLQYLLDRGRISQEQYDGIKANNEYYVSMQRIMEVSPGEDLAVVLPSMRSSSGKIGTGREPIQEFHGSTRTIRNPYTTLMDATYRTVREGDRNYVMSLFRDLLTSDRGMYEGKREDLASVGRLAKAGEKDTIPIYKNGEKEIWQFHPDVYKALKGVDDLAMQLPAFLEVLTYPAKIMRVGITKAPPFALRNLIRDAFQRTVVSNNGSKPWDSLKHYSQKEMDQMSLAGGDQAGYYYRDDRSYQKAMKQAMHKLSGQRNMVVVAGSKLADGYNHIIEGSERQGRMAEYRRAFKKGKTELGYDDYNASLYAASEARGVLDFAIAGNTTRIINRFIPFVTAAIGGLRVAGQALKSHPVRTSALWFASVAMPTLLTYFWNQAHGDLEEYRQLPAYQRDLFWNFKVAPDLWLTIPKPFELGATATTIERMVDKANGNDKAFEGHWKSLAKSFIPVDEAALFGPLQSVGSAVANYDFFRDRAIVPRHEENLDLSLRTTHRASRLGQVLQEAIGVDARKIDFVVENQLGYFGKYATSASDVGRKDRQGFGATSTGVLRPDPVDTARDVKWVHDLAAERGALGTKEWKRFQELKNRYHKAEGREAREQAGNVVREAATKLRARWETKPPRPDAEKKLEKKRQQGPDDPVMRYFRP